MANLMNCYLNRFNIFKALLEQCVVNHWNYINLAVPLIVQEYNYFEKADSTANIGSCEVLIIIKVYITQEPSMGKFLTSAIELLITSQMPSYERISQRCSMLFGTKRRYSGNINDPLQTYI